MKNGLAKTILINLLVLAGLLVLLEIISRVVLHKIYDRSFDSSLIVDNVYGTSAGMRKDAEATVWGKALHTDENGWRKVKNKYPRKNKWLFIGDSVTEGVGVDDSSTFASLCSERYVDFNITNCSLIGYSSNDYVQVLSGMLAQDSAAVELVTVFFCLNDVYGKSKSTELPSMARTNLLGTINGFLQDRYATYKLIKLWFYKNSDRYFNYDLQFYEKDNERFITAMQNLQTCDSICKANNIYFNVIALPYQSQLSSKNFAPQQLIKGFCDTHSIDYSNAADLMVKQPDFASLYLFADEIHFSEKGHKIIADFLSE